MRTADIGIYAGYLYSGMGLVWGKPLVTSWSVGPPLEPLAHDGGRKRGVVHISAATVYLGFKRYKSFFWAVIWLMLKALQETLPLVPLNLLVRQWSNAFFISSLW